MIWSLRQFGRSRTVDRLLWITAACICTCNLVTSIANAQQGRPRYPLAPLQIVSEMENRQLPTRGVQVSLPGPITATIANPPLEIQAVSLLNAHEMRLRVACRDRSECLPFFATATFPDELSPVSVPAKPGDKSPAKLLAVSAVRPATGAIPHAAILRQANPAVPSVLRSGSPATLDFDEERVHIRIEVICLEGGIPGDKIRVASRDRKQVYVAEIVTPTLLKGNF